MSRPRIELDAEQIQQVEALAAYLSIEDIAEYFNLSEKTFRNIRDRQPEVFTAYKKGVNKAKSFVGSKLMSLVRDGNLGAIIFYLKTKGGWTSEVSPKGLTLAQPKAIDDLDEAIEDLNLDQINDYLKALATAKSLVTQEDRGPTLVDLLTDEQKLQLLRWIEENKNAQSN